MLLKLKLQSSGTSTWTLWRSL